jgi:hypothetical protein
VHSMRVARHDVHTGSKDMFFAMFFPLLETTFVQI